MTFVENPRTEIDYTIKAYVDVYKERGIDYYNPVIELWTNGVFQYKRQSILRFTNKADAIIMAHNWADDEIQSLKLSAEQALTQRHLFDTIEEE